MSVLEKNHTFSDYYQERSYIKAIFGFKIFFIAEKRTGKFMSLPASGSGARLFVRFCLKKSRFINFASWSSYDLVDEVRRIRENSYPAQERYQARATEY